MNFKKVFASLLTAAMLIGCGASTGGTATTTTDGGNSEGKVYFLNFKPELDETQGRRHDILLAKSAQPEEKLHMGGVP